MADKRQKTKLFHKVDRDYWKNLEVNIDSFSDKWEEKYAKELRTYLKLFNADEIKAILKYYAISTATKKTATDSFIENLSAAIDFLCVLEFAHKNPKAVSELFGIPIQLGHVDKKAVTLKIFEEHKKRDLPKIFLLLIKQKYGKGEFKYSFDGDIKDADFEQFNDSVNLLTRHLKRYDPQGKTYYYRFHYKDRKQWIFLLLKETADVIYPAIPNNVRVLRGQYILITIKPEEKILEVNTKSQPEAYRIKDYLSRKTSNTLYHKRDSAIYNSTSFFNQLINEAEGSDLLNLTDVDFKESTLAVGVKISDSHHKNKIYSQLRTLKDKNILKLIDFSEFKSLTFNYKDLAFKVIVEENKWGQHRLNLFDKGKPQKEKNSFKADFEKVFKVPLDVYLKNADETIDLTRHTRKLIEKPTIDAALPKEIEDILIELIDLKILQKPTKTSKRRCINPSCRKLTWAKGDCPSCGNNLRIEGDYIDIKPNDKGTREFVFNKLNSLGGFSVKKTGKQIEGTRFQLIDMMDKKGRAISIFLTSKNVPDKITRYFQETGSPLLIVLTKYKEALARDINEQGFSCIDIADIFSHRDLKERLIAGFEKIVETQKQMWHQRILKKGYKSYLSITGKKDEYTDQYFERDIFNLLHEMFTVADRLGGKFAGIPAPDGIISIQNHSAPLKRYCFAWDCKFSVSSKGYQLADNPAKHKHYINTLKKNSKVILYGGLQTYAIISQNMDMKKYETFYAALVKRFQFKGNILYIPENAIVRLYKLYRDNMEIIQDSPHLFYIHIHKLFKDITAKDSKPFKVISDERIKSLVEGVEKSFADNQINFVFERHEFNK